MKHFLLAFSCLSFSLASAAEPIEVWRRFSSYELLGWCSEKNFKSVAAIRYFLGEPDITVKVTRKSHSELLHQGSIVWTYHTSKSHILKIGFLSNPKDEPVRVVKIASGIISGGDEGFVEIWHISPDNERPEVEWRESDSPPEKSNVANKLLKG